jgi:hypothetical protein
VIRALPIATNQFAQTRMYMTGHLLTPEDHIPQQIYFDMTRPEPAYVPGPQVYGYPPPVYYYGPTPFFYGPSFRFYYGPRVYHGHRWHR